ncbi:hypothetical protein [Companilactobacillus jidongensis]|uniref:hypothetical protein n=1 Tax=Companilactobacillus jidongensis TaxID=2486006 RepID=UPI000F79A5AA|nr:hypothetical protein [Companilactobacillus jidongensis]
MKLVGIEIENPYRYRAYFIGQKPLYNIQSNDFIDPSYGKVKSIKTISLSDMETYTMEYDITFEDGRSISIQDCAGMILHCEVEEKNGNQ